MLQSYRNRRSLSRLVKSALKKILAILLSSGNPALLIALYIINNFFFNSAEIYRHLNLYRILALSIKGVKQVNVYAF